MEKDNIFSELRRRADLAESVIERAGEDSRRAEIVSDIAKSAVSQLEQVTDPVEAQKLATRLKIRGVLEILAGIGLYKLGEHFMGRFGEQKEIQDVILWMVAILAPLMSIIDGIKCFPRARDAKILSADIRDVLRKEEARTGSDQN